MAPGRAADGDRRLGPSSEGASPHRRARLGDGSGARLASCTRRSPGRDRRRPAASSNVAGELWAKMARGADLAVASRRVKGGGVDERWTIWRRIASRGAQLVGIALVPGVTGRVSDPMSGFFLVRRSLVEGITLNPCGFKILLEVLGRTRPRRVAEVGYIFGARQTGASKATAKVFWDYLLHLLRLRFQLQAETIAATANQLPYPALQPAASRGTNLLADRNSK